MADQGVERIRVRRKVIATAIRTAMANVAALRKEDDELAIAERVLLRFAEGEVVPAPSKRPRVRLEAAPRRHERKAGGNGDGRRKPVGTPTLPEMIVEALQHAHGATTQGGLEPKEITEYIANRWWPDIQSTDAGPIAWRMWKRGELRKIGSIYALPKDEAPSEDQSEGAS